jgi:predicted metal-binding membrane protein
MLFTANPVTSLATGWVLMLVAMMAPTLVPAIYHIHVSSFTERRARSVAFFACGYGAIWMAAGVILLGAEFAGIWLAPQSYLPAVVVGVIALLWQASPIKQRCLNQCHDHRPLTAFGAAADWDALRMGLEHSVWCVGSCWALMLFPMLLPHGHFVVMVMVSALMFCERLDSPKELSWRWRGFGAALRHLSRRLRGPQCSPALFPPNAEHEPSRP